MGEVEESAYGRDLRLRFLLAGALLGALVGALLGNVLLYSAVAMALSVLYAHYKMQD